MRLKKMKMQNPFLFFLVKNKEFSGEYCMTELVTSALDPDGK